MSSADKSRFFREGTPVDRIKLDAVTALGLITVVWGGGHVALAAFCNLPGDYWAGGGQLGVLAPVQCIAGGAFDSNVGTAFALQGILGMLAGSGILLRLQWGRILTILLAIAAILWTLEAVNACIVQGDEYQWKIAVIPFAAIQILFTTLAFIILVRNGTAFSEPEISTPTKGNTGQKGESRSIHYWSAWASPAAATVVSLSFWFWIENHQGVRGQRPMGAVVFCLVVLLLSAAGGATAVFSLFGVKSRRNALDIIPGALLGGFINGANALFSFMAYLYEGVVF